MLTPFQSVKLEDWANHVLVNGHAAPMPRGVSEVDYWIATVTLGRGPFPFPRFDMDQPYTFGED